MTLGAVWSVAAGPDDLDDVLVWPPDVFALVDRVLDASEIYRFVVSPPPGAKLAGICGGAGAAAIAWLAWLDGAAGDEPPEAVLRSWQVVRAAIDVDIEELSAGRRWDVTEALLALYAIADEACAGLGSSTAAAPTPGRAFRAAARELLAEVGSLSRISPGVARVLPRCRSGVGGISLRSLSRHVFVSGPQVDVEWHRMLSRPAGVTFPEAHANGVLLPWPLRVRARDFRTVDYALAHMDPTEVGFFSFAPEEALDLDLVEGVLRAAVDEAGTVDFVFVPEAALTPEEVEPLEALLGDYGVWCLVAGVREPSIDGRLGRNWVHVGVRQELVWRHAVQHKHHRWRLDGRQIAQYHLGGALSPTMHWWEAVSVPRRSLQVIDQGAVTIVPLVCEDLARLEPVADLVRSIGPSLVVTLLLDGPQLGSRWTARYASVLADDPGSAVCTLTSYGMVRRCRPTGYPPSSVVALWKDASGELTEIELEDGAQAVLMATHVTVGDAATADGRKHPGTTSTLALAAVRSLHVEVGTGPAPTATARMHATPASADATDVLPPLDEHEISKATSWAEAVAEAAAATPTSIEPMLERASASEWRARLGLPPPSRLFEEAIGALRRELERPPTLERLYSAAGRLRACGEAASVVTGTLLEIALEQRVAAEVWAGRLAPDALHALSDAKVAE